MEDSYFLYRKTFFINTLDGCYFFLYKMAGVNPLHKTFYVMVLWGYSPAILYTY